MRKEALNSKHVSAISRNFEVFNNSKAILDTIIKFFLKLTKTLFKLADLNTIFSVFQALNKEYNALQISSSRRLTELEGKEGELKSKLHIYEKMEEELDDVVMQAAESKMMMTPGG